MKNFIPGLIALGLFAIPASSQTASSSAAQAETRPAPKDAETEIRQLEDDWLKAERSNNPALLEKILSDDFVNLGPNGLSPAKTQLIKNWERHAGEALAYTVETSDMHIFMLGDTAVAAYVKTYTAKENGNVAWEDTTHIFTRDHGAWKLRISRSSSRQNSPE